MEEETSAITFNGQYLEVPLLAQPESLHQTLMQLEDFVSLEFLAELKWLDQRGMLSMAE